jgi:hypothetical protein
MSKNGSTQSPRKGQRTGGAKAGQTLDLERYVPAFVTFIANKLSRSATVFYQKHFGIKTDPTDGRSHSISLTSNGRAVHNQVIVAALERERRLLACLRKDEREVLIDLLRRVHANLGAVTGQTEP